MAGLDLLTDLGTFGSHFVFSDVNGADLLNKVRSFYSVLSVSKETFE